MSISGILQNINTKALSIIGIIATIVSTTVTILSAQYTIVGIIFAVVAIIAFSLLVYDALRKHETKKRKREIDLDLNDFHNYLNGVYIPANIRDLQSDEPNLIRPFFEYFWEIINRKQVESRHICLLGETGSGKTDALVHLYLKYINEYCTQPSAIPNIRLFSMKMGYPKLLKTIKSEISPKKRRKTILLLDALDECKEARDSLANTPDNNPTLFMKRLAQDTKDFAWVLVSCRNQFFQSEAFYPSDTGVEIGKSKSVPHWHNLHLELFDEAQMENYLIQHFDPSNPDSLYEDTKKIASKYKEIFQRPLLLENIDIVLKEYHNPQEPLTIKKVYDAIILFWINKETKYDASKTKEVLSNSLCVAEYMYKNKLMYLDEDHYKKMCEEYEIDDPDNLFRINSLLKSDKEGYCFVHQSFYEHLLAYCFFLNPNVIDSVQGLFDSTLVTYEGILDVYKLAEGEKQILGKGIVPVPYGALAKSLNLMGYELSEIHYFSKAERFFNEALIIYKDLAKNDHDTFISDVADTLNGLAILHRKNNHHKEAEKEYQEALKIYRELAEKNPDTYLPLLAKVLSNMGVLLLTTNRYSEAEKVLLEAWEIRRQLAEMHPDAYLPDMTETLNNLAGLHYKTNHYADSEKEFEEALETNRMLAEKNPETVLPEVAGILNNLGLLHTNINRYTEAEKELQEALDIRIKSVNKHPGTKLPDVALTLNNLGLLHNRTNRNEDAEKEFKEALEIYRHLAEINPNAYLPDVADTLYYLADLHIDTHSYDDADRELNEALGIYRQFAERIPDAYLPKVASTLEKMAILHGRTNHYSDAEMEFENALRIVRQFAEKQPDAYLPNMAMTLLNTASLYLEKGKLQKAEDAAQESLEIFQQMSELSHAAFDKHVIEAQDLLDDIQSMKSAWSLS